MASALVPELQPVSLALAEKHTRTKSIDDPYRYVYFNRRNLYLKCSPKAGRAGPAGRLGLSHTLNASLHQLYADFEEGKVREVAFRSVCNGWVVGRTSGSRLFFLWFDASFTSLAEVHNEVQALSAMHFTNIFLDQER